MSLVLQFRQAIIAAGLLLFALGAVKLTQLPVSLFPKSTKPTVRLTLSHDMDIVALKQSLGEKIEQALLNIENIEQVEATYSKGKATFLLRFQWNKPANQAVNESTAVAAFFQTQLPDHLPPIRVDYIDSGIENYVAVRSDKYSAAELSLLVESKLKPVLASMPGLHKSFVSKVNREEVRIEVNPYALIRHGVSFNDVLAVLNQARFNLSLGTIAGNDSRADVDVFYLRRVESLSALKDLVVSKQAQRLIRLKDIAQIKLALGEQDRVYYIDENAVVAVAAWPQPNANLYQFSQQFQHTVSSQLADIGEVVFLNDPLAYINDSLEQVTLAIMLSMAFSALAVLVAFRSLNLTLLIALVIPSSLFGAVILLQWFNVGLNLVSLAAMSVSCGLVIDNAVVVIDAICSQVSHAKPQTKAQFNRCVIQSVKQTQTAILSASLTTLVVFLPLAFTAPVVYSLVGELSLVVVAILTLSIGVSLLFIPALILAFANLFGRWRMFERSPQSTKALSNRLYRYLMGHLLQLKSVQLLFIAGFIGLSVFAVHLLQHDIRKEIVAEPHPNIIDIELSFTSADYTQAFREALIAPVRAQVAQLSGEKVKYVFTDMRKGLAYLSLHLKDFHDAQPLMALLRQTITANTHYSVNVSPWVSAKLSVPQIPDHRIMVYGLNEDEVRTSHKALADALRSDPEVLRVKVYPRAQRHQQAHILANQSQLKTMGMDISQQAFTEQVLPLVNHALEPRKLYDMRFAQGEVPLKLQLAQGFDIDSLSNIPLAIDNQTYALRHLIAIEQAQAWSHYYTRNGQQSFLIEVWFNAMPQAQKQQKLERLLAAQTTDSVNFNLEDTQPEIWQNIESLMQAQLLALALVIVVLLAANGSFAYTAMTLLSIPLGLIGAALALYWFDSTLSVNSLVGLLILTGLTINNTILITEKFTQLMRQGQLSLAQAVIEAASSRLRAMFVTSASTILGMIPIAMALGGNGNIMQPLGISVAAGLAVSLFGSLILSPILLYWVNRTQATSAPQTQLS